MREEADLDHALRGTLALDPEAAGSRDSLSSPIPPIQKASMHACRAGAKVREAITPGRLTTERTSLVERPCRAAIVGADVTEFSRNDGHRTPVTLYLFHLVRTLLDGRRLVCWADEFWRVIDDEAFEQFAKDGPKTWRKLNGVICIATQSPSDVLGARISRTIIEQTPTKVFFPNPDANVNDYVAGFGLSEREFRLVKERVRAGFANVSGSAGAQQHRLSAGPQRIRRSGTCHLWARE